MQNRIRTDGGKRDTFIKKSRELVSEALKSRDMLLASLTRTIDDMDKIINLLNERLGDWYAVYFPELRSDDPIKYAQIVLEFDKENPDYELLKKMFGEKKAENLLDRCKTTLGAKISENDLKNCRMLAQEIMNLHTLKGKYAEYQNQLVQEICPNIAHLAGPGLAAKLITHIGSLKRFALLPASTVQIMGAEKALFKHLKNRRVAPPKHGLIFQLPQLGSAPKRVRGKIARAIANKLALAAKADAFTKRFIAEDLKKDFETRVKYILEEAQSSKPSNKPAKYDKPEVRDENPRFKRHSR